MSEVIEGRFGENQKVLFVGGFCSGSWLGNIFGRVSRLSPDKKWQIPSPDFTSEVFTLNNNEILTWLDLCPEKYLRLYRETRSACVGEELKNELKSKIEEYNPDIIFCHSLGCLLLVAILNQGFEISDNTRIIFSHADTDTIPALSNIENYYSPFDIALWVSTIVNLKLAAGLRLMDGICNIRSKNRFHNVEPGILEKLSTEALKRCNIKTSQ
jgi:hypothetical protein